MTAATTDDQRVPFTLLGGYLGAGKTTIVNHVLAHSVGRRIVVLVNDVGAIDVDVALIAAHDGDTLSLSNGCVCCTLADDFTVTLERVRDLRPRPDHVLMELSGVAEPARVAPWANTAGFRLDGTFVAADADQIGELAARRYVGDTIREQLGAADIVLLTKTDLTADGGAGATAVVRTMSGAPVVRVEGGAVDVGLLLGHASSAGSTSSDDEPSTGRAPRAGHRAAVVEVGTPTVAELEELIAGLPADVVRAKGLVRCAGENAPCEVQVVGRRRSVRRRPGLDLASAGDAIVAISVPR
ncbi:MAG: GTP-binding protein [Ilumatobacter sp.]|uniref:CobW family GTP-binding protein n=1 Tax=Ilumatobacter sp. TaxID=1967498 RepID=UPI00261FA775|nr:GTP-binding protein [Ilumatobacter sp.]MDJ0769888.1 GTP-binding protein [Ilumatobacter sp.]